MIEIPMVGCEDGCPDRGTEECVYCGYGASFECGTEAQLLADLRWFVEWGSADCNAKHGYSVATGKACLWKECWHKPIKQKECRICWQELKKLAVG